MFNIPVPDIVNPIFNFLDILPDFPDEFYNLIASFLDLIFENITVVGFFFNWNIIMTCLPIAIALITVPIMFKLVMWILRKIPFLGIS